MSRQVDRGGLLPQERLQPAAQAGSRPVAGWAMHRVVAANHQVLRVRAVDGRLRPRPVSLGLVAAVPTPPPLGLAAEHHSVEEDKVDRGGVFVCERRAPPVLQRWVVPPRARPRGVVQLRGNVSIVIMVASDGPPEALALQCRVGIHCFEGAPPAWSIGAFHPTEVEVIAQGKHKERRVLLRGDAHCMRDLSLPRSCPRPHRQATPIAQGKKVQVGKCKRAARSC